MLNALMVYSHAGFMTVLDAHSLSEVARRVKIVDRQIVAHGPAVGPRKLVRIFVAVTDKPNSLMEFSPEALALVTQIGEPSEKPRTVSKIGKVAAADLRTDDIIRLDGPQSEGGSISVRYRVLKVQRWADDENSELRVRAYDLDKNKETHLFFTMDEHVEVQR